MKTVKTSNGLRWIEDQDDNFVSLQLREVLQDQRKSLIERLLHENGLIMYVRHKLALKLNLEQLTNVKDQLTRLMASGIDYRFYHPILRAVIDRDHTTLDMTLFYREIDSCIHNCLQDSQLKLSHIDGSMFGMQGLLDGANASLN